MNREIHYLYGGNGLAGIYVRTDGKDTLFAAVTDRQNSLTAVMDVATGKIEKFSYKPWGMRRNPANWSENVVTDYPARFSRGYCMHEHMPQLGLINMGGRVFDERTNQFLSADPYRQAPESWLNCNRFGYCMGNPVMYTDPDGEVWWIPVVIGALVGSYSGGVMANDGQKNPFGSYDFTNNSFGFLGKKGNSALENVGYALGAMANVCDALAGLHPEKVDLVTEHSDAIGHSAIVNSGTETGSGLPMRDPNALISVGPDPKANGSWHWKKGINGWYSHSNKNDEIWRQTIVANKKIIQNYGEWLNKLESNGKLIYSVELSSCVTHTSVALNMSGIFNVGIHPYILNAQMALWSNGIRPWSFCYQLNN